MPFQGNPNDKREGSIFGAIIFFLICYLIYHATH